MRRDFVERHAARLLEEHPYTGAHAADVCELLDSCTLQRVEAGQAICRQGDAAGALFVLLVGRVWVLQHDDAGVAHTLAVFSRPRVFGHLGALDGRPREATCLAEGPVLMARLPGHRALAMLSATEGAGCALRRLLLHSLTDELGQATASLRSATHAPVSEPEYFLPAPARYAG